MPLTFSTAHTNLIASGYWKRMQAVIITLTSGAVLKFATRNITVGSDVFIDKLKGLGDIRTSMTRAIDNCPVEIYNADAATGNAMVISNEELDGATCELFEIRQNQSNPADIHIESLLFGVIEDIKAGDELLTFTAVSLTNASKTTFGDFPILRVCPHIYKGNKCGYVGSLPSCDKTYDGSNGCQTHFPDGQATAHFGGHGVYIDDKYIEQLKNAGGNVEGSSASPAQDLPGRHEISKTDRDGIVPYFGV